MHIQYIRLVVYFQPAEKNSSSYTYIDGITVCRALCCLENEEHAYLVKPLGCRDMNACLIHSHAPVKLYVAYQQGAWPPPPLPELTRPLRYALCL
jgi:hypothetical protein